MSAREERMVPPAEPVSYYGRPVLKEPSWKWMIPAYFFTGGTAAGSAVLALGGRARGNRRLARAANLSAVTMMGASALLLIEDLGQPERFAKMLRVFKPTSPLSMGTWLLSGFGPLTGVASLCDLTGLFPRVGVTAEVGAAALAPAVATYTAVLVSDTAIPAWREAHSDLPFVFASGAAASSGALMVLLLGPSAARPARRMALVGAAAELLTTRAMEVRLGDAGEVYKQGTAGRLSKVATAATGAGAALMLLAGSRRRGLARLGALCVLGGAAAERFAVMEAGRQSARDPKYTVGPQRARSDAREEAREIDITNGAVVRSASVPTN
jgi:formate-dependent nitrite reductase membrane component NrfD